MQEWRRVLAGEGVLRLAVPNFDKLVEVYKKTVYNFDSLKAVLEENGFSNVKLYDWRERIHKDYDDHSQAYYPHMDKENGILISLNVEAQKLL